MQKLVHLGTITTSSGEMKPLVAVIEFQDVFPDSKYWEDHEEGYLKYSFQSLSFTSPILGFDQQRWQSIIQAIQEGENQKDVTTKREWLWRRDSIF